MTYIRDLSKNGFKQLESDFKLYLDDNMKINEKFEEIRKLKNNKFFVFK